MAALNQARHEMHEAAAERLRVLVLDAVGVLGELLEDSHSEVIRLKAAMAVIQAATSPTGATDAATVAEQMAVEATEQEQELRRRRFVAEMIM